MTIDDSSAGQAAGVGNLDRRRILEAALACLTGLALPATAAALTGPAGAAAAWRAQVPDTRAAAAVGRRYLEQYPQEASAQWLEQQLFGTKLPAGDAGPGSNGLLERLRRGRQQDFSAGAIVVLDGWFFARTEARLLALISLQTA